MYFQQLTPMENSLLQLFLVDFLGWKNVLEKQVLCSKVTRSDCYSSYFVDFFLNESAPKIQTNTVVPIEIIIGEIRSASRKVLSEGNCGLIIEPKAIFVPDDDALAVRLHFQNGYLRELEAYMLDGNKLDTENILEKERTYIIRDKKFLS